MNCSNLMRSSRRSARKGRWFHLARVCMRRGPLALLMLANAAAISAQDAQSVEYQVKAAFLLNFARFVTWPADAFPNEKSPITFCVFRYDPFGTALDDVLREKSINNRGATARRINELTEVKACQLVFISEREEKRLPEILNAAKGASTLLVGDGADFAQRGGAIQFFLENNKLRFAINVDAIQGARLQASSKLLALARIVHGDSPPNGN